MTALKALSFVKPVVMMMLSSARQVPRRPD
jgi:hypothetical protein